MSRFVLQFELSHNKFFMDHGDSGIPSNTPASGTVLSIGAGSSYPVLETVAGHVLDIRASFSHSSGDARAIYNRLALTGGGDGEALRCFTNVDSNVNNARGAHISLNFKATAGESECAGTGAALTCTTHIPNISSWAPTGTLYGAQVQLYSDGTASDPEGLTTLACLALGNDGHADGRDDVDDDAFLLHLTGWDAGAAHMFATGLTAVSINALTTASLKIKIDAVTYYIPIATGTG